MKCKRWISLLMAAVLTVSIVLPGRAVELATESKEATETVGEIESIDETARTVQTNTMIPADGIDIAEQAEAISKVSAEEPGIAVMSLLPLQEVRAYWVLNDKTEEEIKAMPLSEVLSKLQDSNGNYDEFKETANNQNGGN